MSDVRRPASVRSSWRRGSALLFTLLGCLVVATLGVGTLLAVRIERQAATAAMDGYQAALFAQAGIDMAFYRIDHDPDWRAKAAAGAWSGPQALGTGSYTITMADPVDGDLADSEFDPVVITVRGDRWLGPPDAPRATGCRTARIRVSAIFDSRQRRHPAEGGGC